jgi:hypothetical protein
MAPLPAMDYVGRVVLLLLKRSIRLPLPLLKAKGSADHKHI